MCVFPTYTLYLLFSPHAKLSCEWPKGIGSARAKTGKSYENEYLMMFKLTDGTESSDGKPKIIELKEFMDSLYISNWAAEVGKTLTQLVSHTLFCFLAPSMVPNSSYSDYRNNNTNPIPCALASVSRYRTSHHLRSSSFGQPPPVRFMCILWYVIPSQLVLRR